MLQIFMLFLRMFFLNTDNFEFFERLLYISISLFKKYVISLRISQKLGTLKGLT